VPQEKHRVRVDRLVAGVHKKIGAQANAGQNPGRYLIAVVAAQQLAQHPQPQHAIEEAGQHGGVLVGARKPVERVAVQAGIAVRQPKPG
jgi:K+/H+ antiporter YhaU regulatory subunit KhtT